MGTNYLCGSLTMLVTTFCLKQMLFKQLVALYFCHFCFQVACSFSVVVRPSSTLVFKAARNADSNNYAHMRGMASSDEVLNWLSQ